MPQQGLGGVEPTLTVTVRQLEMLYELLEAVMDFRDYVSKTSGNQVLWSPKGIVLREKVLEIHEDVYLPLWEKVQRL